MYICGLASIAKKPLWPAARVASLKSAIWRIYLVSCPPLDFRGGGPLTVQHISAIIFFNSPRVGILAGS